MVYIVLHSSTEFPNMAVDCVAIQITTEVCDALKLQMQFRTRYLKSTQFNPRNTWSNFFVHRERN